MSRVIVFGYDEGGCGMYRSKEPYRTIKSETEFFLSNKLEDAFDGEKFTVEGALCQRPVDFFLPYFLVDLKKHGKVGVVETDDLLDNIPASNPAKHVHKGDVLKIYKACLHHAQYIHTSTPELAKSLGKKAVVFPNAIDLTKYTEKKQRTSKVMWAGSATHSESLLLIRPVIKELIARKIQVVLMGDPTMLMDLFDPSDYLELVPPVPAEAYYMFPKMADVFLTPLPDNQFSHAKSELKCLEAAAWGVPSVSSAVAPYIRFNKVSNGGNSIVRKERLKYWLTPILDLLQDNSLWEKHSKLSYVAVEKHYNLKIVNEKRALWWKEVLANKEKIV